MILSRELAVIMNITIILSRTNTAHIPTEMISDAKKIPLDKVTDSFFSPQDFFSLA